MAQGFAALLRQNRTTRQLTQETLAERSGVSCRTIVALECDRGRGPRPGTAERLAAALGLDGHELDAFVAAGRSQFWESRSRQRTQP
jgi:transcriptional regulator with XRE-family HTH domain